jgi:hypothetical protein
MNLNTSLNLVTLPPPGFVYRGQAGLAPNEFFGYGSTQTLVPINSKKVKSNKALKKKFRFIDIDKNK